MHKTLLFSFTLFMLSLLFSGCGKNSNPVGPEQPAHIDAVGCLIKQGETEIAHAENGVITGAIAVKERVQTPLLSFYLIAKDGTPFQPDDKDLLFAWQSKNSQVADAIQFETDGAWNFHVKGFEAGQTSIEFKVLRGDSEDFVSLQIPVQVSASSGGGLGK